MATDLTVTFSGDASNLNQTIAQAKQTIASFSPGATSGAKSGLDALQASFQANRTSSDQATASWRQNIATLADLTIIARNAAAAIGEVAEVEAKSAAIDASAAWNVQKVTMQADIDVARRLIATMAGIPGVFGSAASAAYGYADALAHGSGAARSFLHDQDGLLAGIGRMVVGAKTAVDSLRLSFTGLARAELDAIMASGNGQAFLDAVGLENVKKKLDDFTADLRQIPGISDASAGAIEAMLGTIPSYSEQANEALIELIQTISANGDEAVANATKITSAFKDDTATGGTNMADMVGVLVDRLKASTQNAAAFKAQMGDINVLTRFFASTLQPASASAYFSAIITKLKDQATASKANIAVNEAALASYGILGKAMLAIQGQSVQLEKDANAERQKAITLLEGMKAASDQVNAVTARQSTFDATLDKANPLDAQIAAVQGKIAILQGQLNIGTGKTGALTPEDITTLVRTVIGEASSDHEQQLAVAAVALNRLANGNFGDSLTAILKAGNGTQFNTWKPLDAGGSPTNQANAPASTSSYLYQEILHDIVQPLLDKKVADPTGGALNFYNPTLTKPQNQFAMTGAQTIGQGDTAQVFGTAKNSPAAVDPMDPDTIEKTKQALAALQDQLAQLNATKAGGTEVEKAQLVITQQNAAGIHDEVAQAKLLLDAHKADLASAQAGSPGKVREQQEATAQAAIALSDKEAAVQKANDDAAIAQTIQGSREWLTATLTKYDHEEARATGNAALIADLEKQKLEAIRTYNKSAAEDATTTENEKYAAAKRSLDDQMAALKTAQAEGSLSALQVLDQTKAIQSEELNLEESHLQTLVQKWAQFPSEYRKYQAQLAAIAAQRRSEDLNAELKYQEEIVNSYRQHMDQMASTISSSLSAIIERTGTWRDLLRNIAKSVEQQFISSSLKMAADWAVDRTKDVAVTVATQAQSTAAVVSGNAAREASTIASDAQAAVSAARSFAATIAADAKATFAGVFAFLSPVMGPLAAGPAAGAAATVASYDVGAWSLPADQIAMVHQNEMIIPAGPAQAFRDAVAGGGARGGDTHNWGGITVNNPRSGLDIVDAIRSNARAINRALSTTPRGL